MSSVPDQGPPDHANVPDHVDELVDFVVNNSGPYKGAVRQGEDVAHLGFVEVHGNFGSGSNRAELVFEGGNHVTVNVERDLDGVWQA